MVLSKVHKSGLVAKLHGVLLFCIYSSLRKCWYSTIPRTPSASTTLRGPLIPTRTAFAVLTSIDYWWQMVCTNIDGRKIHLPIKSHAITHNALLHVVCLLVTDMMVFLVQSPGMKAFNDFWKCWTTVVINFLNWRWFFVCIFKIVVKPLPQTIGEPRLTLEIASTQWSLGTLAVVMIITEILFHYLRKSRQQTH